MVKKAVKSAVARALAKRYAKTVVVKTQALAVQPPHSDHPMAIIERVAKDKTVDVAKLGKLIELQKDMLRTQAKIDFDQAFAEMAPLLPTIGKRGKILGKDKSVRSTYARLGEDIHPVIKPILSRFGFAIRHRTEWPAPGTVRIVGVLAHRSGHAEESAFEAPADTSDYRSHVQSLGSTVSYGRRYTTIDLLNLTVHGSDDDGRKGAPVAPVVPVVHPDAHGDEPITPEQRRRLFTIARTMDRQDAELSVWLAATYGVDTTKAIKRKDYAAIVAAVERPGKLVLPREPVVEG